VGRRHRHLQEGLTAAARICSLALLAAGCSVHPPLDLRAVAGSETVELTAVPFHAQLDHQCGPAALLALLEHSGVEVSYDAVVQRVYVPGLEGSLQVEMAAAARHFGRIAYSLPPRPEAVFAEVSQGRPVVALFNLGVPSRPVWHYAVVVGFDPQAGRVLLRSGRDRRQTWRASSWLRRWDWGGRWALVALRPGEWPAAADRRRLLQALADFETGAPPLQAREAWLTAAERWPDEPLVWLGLGNAAHGAGDPAAAVMAFRRALGVAPAHLAARLNLATVLEAAGDPCGGLSQLGPPPDPAHPLAARFTALEGELRSSCASQLPERRETPAVGVEIPTQLQ
jgi:hypothetical protein